MKTPLILGIVLILFMGGIFSAQATPPLTDTDIEHFIQAVPSLQKLGEKYKIDKKTDTPPEQKGIEEFSPMTYSLEKVRKHKAYPEFKTIIDNAGFSSVEEWADIGDRILRTFILLKANKKITPEHKQEMQKYIDEMQKNEYLSPEIKKQMLESFKIMMASSNDVPHGMTADQQALTPYLAELERLFKEQK